jgi:hypothetical protein
LFSICLSLAAASWAAAPQDSSHFKDMTEAQIAQALVQLHKDHPAWPALHRG